MKRVLIRVSVYAALVMLLMGCKGNQSESLRQSDQDSITAAPAVELHEGDTGQKIIFQEGSLKIVWVDIDSLLHNYDYYFEQQRQMGEMTAKAEKEIQTKGKSLERRVASFQDKAEKGLLTRSEMQKEQESLQAAQAELLQLQERHRQQLMEEEQVRTRKVMSTITEFVKKYNETHGYDYILSGPMLYGNPGLNVTRDVLRGLNAEYAASHKTAGNQTK